jgi:hypothetical protein
MRIFSATPLMSKYVSSICLGLVRPSEGTKSARGREGFRFMIEGLGVGVEDGGLGFLISSSLLWVLGFGLELGFRV